MNLNESIEIGSLGLKNRTIFAPVKTGYGVASGEARDDYVRSALETVINI